MRKLDKIIAEYLSKDTEYAVQIKGDWGSGKTYFYRNVLEKQICETPSYADNRKKYKPIYISLFGLKSVEDIATKVVLDFYQSKLFDNYYKRSLFGKKHIRITQNIFKIGLRGFLNFNQLGNLNDYFTDIKEIGKDVLGTGELVICFDDLERKDSSLHIEDLTGYINSLVDEKVKVLILSNEDLLLKYGDDYKNFKEKIIGITLEFSPNAESTIISIINLRFSGFPVYVKYLKENIQLLVNISLSLKNNYRHLIYALDCLHICYAQIKNTIIDTNNELKEHVESELPNIAILVLTLASEYKSTNIENSDKQDFSNESIRFIDMLSPRQDGQTQENDDKKPKYKKLFEKYKINSIDYQFYESIFNYVTGFDEFEIQTFINEFKQKFNIDRGKILPQYEMLNSLSYPNCYSLSDIEYLDQTNKVIEYAENGDYSLADYLSIMHFVERFDNPFKFDFDKVFERLILGFKKRLDIINSESSIEFSQFKASGKPRDISDLISKFYHNGLNEIKLLQEKVARDKLDNYAKLFINNPVQFQSKYYANDDLMYYVSNYPLVNYMQPQDFLDVLTNSVGDFIYFLKEFFTERYKDSDMLKKEIEQFDKILILFEKYRDSLNTEATKIRHYLIDELLTNISLIRDNYKKAIK